MANHFATVKWHRNGEDFGANKYSRAHEWEFDGGLIVPASPSPSIVPAPYSTEENVDPEEAFVASLSSCHMLFYLHLARDAGLVVNSYEDKAIGILEKNSKGKMAVTQVTLTPVVEYEGNCPTQDLVAKLHHAAHEQCFIANSVTTEIITNTDRS